MHKSLATTTSKDHNQRNQQNDQPSSASDEVNLKSQLIGINNRNLNNFETRIETTIELSNYIGDLNKIFISESGFHSHSDVSKIISLTGINNFLIGEYLMKSEQLSSDISNILN